ncbi:MAG: rhamnogalacturonan acetylesterase [Rikenellaceae bacterium]|nr:rhamnogalacturonan acetylesterase [Rikenellaceae bacterium]
MNDNAVQYYSSPHPIQAPGAIFSWETDHRYYAPKAGSTRKNNRPVIFLIGDSTVKNGRGDGGKGNEWSWGSFFQNYIDTTRITVENHALGGRSSRTFITEGHWKAVLPGIRSGDYVLIQMGHNDGGPLDTGRARASLKGVGEESQTVTLEATGGKETVYTYGHSLRRYVRQTKAQGAIPILLSPTPSNRYTEGRVNRYDQTYAKWAREVAEQEGVDFIDLNEISARKVEAMGIDIAREKLYYDTVHTTYDGAILNAESVVEGIRELPDTPLKHYLK